MKRYISALLIFATLLSFSGCSFSTQDLENQLKAEASEAVDELVENAIDHVEDEIDNAVEEEKKKASSLWGDLIGCKHTPYTYKEKNTKVTCQCGANTFENLTYTDFEKCISKSWPPNAWFRDHNEYVSQQYIKYVAVNNEIDPTIIEFLLNLEISNVDDHTRETISNIVGSCSDIAGIVSKCADFNDFVSEGCPKLPRDDFFATVSNYHNTMSTTLFILKTGIDVYDLADTIKSGGDKTEELHALVKVLKDATTKIPIHGLVFDKALDTIEAGIEVVFKGYEIKLVQYALQKSMSVDGNLYNLRNSDKMWFKETWKDGPSLAELSNANLSAEEMAGVSAYIEYRVDLEIKETLGIGFNEIVEQYTDR